MQKFLEASQTIGGVYILLHHYIDLMVPFYHSCPQREAANTQYRVIRKAQDIPGTTLWLYCWGPQRPWWNWERCLWVCQQDGAQAKWPNHGSQGDAYLLSCNEGLPRQSNMTIGGLVDLYIVSNFSYKLSVDFCIVLTVLEIRQPFVKQEKH